MIRTHFQTALHLSAPLAIARFHLFNAIISKKTSTTPMLSSGRARTGCTGHHHRPCTPTVRGIDAPAPRALQFPFERLRLTEARERGTHRITYQRVDASERLLVQILTEIGVRNRRDHGNLLFNPTTYVQKTVQQKPRRLNPKIRHGRRSPSPHSPTCAA